MSLHQNTIRSLATAVMCCAVLFLTAGFADAQTAADWDGTTDLTWTGANWTVTPPGGAGQTVTPTIPSDGSTFGPTYSLFDWTVGSAGSPETISEANQIRLDGGSLTVVDSTITLDSEASTLTGDIVSLILGDLGNGTTTNFTNSTLNVSRLGGGGSAIQVNGGSQFVFDNSTLNATSASNGADIRVNGSSATFQNGSVVMAARDLRIRDGSTGMFTGAIITTGQDVQIYDASTMATFTGGSITTGRELRIRDGAVANFQNVTIDIGSDDLDMRNGGTATFVDSTVDIFRDLDLQDASTMVMFTGGSITTGREFRIRDDSVANFQNVAIVIESEDLDMRDTTGSATFVGSTVDIFRDLDVTQGTATFLGSTITVGDDIDIGSGDGDTGVGLTVGTLTFDGSTVTGVDDITARGILNISNGSNISGFDQIRSHSDTGGTIISIDDSIVAVIRLDLDDLDSGVDNQFLFGDGNTMTLSSGNPLTGNSSTDGDFDWVVSSALTSILTTTDNLSETQDLAGRFANGYFSLNGVLVDPTTEYNNTNEAIALINAELLADANAGGVGTLYFQIAGDFDTGNQTLQVFAIPEPSSCVVLGLGLMGLLVRRRR